VAVEVADLAVEGLAAVDLAEEGSVEVVDLGVVDSVEVAYLAVEGSAAVDLEAR
jgi:hypothetical protein